MNLGAHADFILAAYGLTMLIIAALVGWVWLDHRAQTRILAGFKESGVARRSERTSANWP